MMTSQEVLPNIFVYTPNTGRFGADTAQSLLDIAASSNRRQGMLLDLSKIRTLTTCGISALIELNSQAQMDVMLIGLSARARKKLNSFGLARMLPQFDTTAAALATDGMQRLQLSSTKAVVLCSGKGTRMAPLSWDQPKPMLDILGKPVLERIIDHVSGFGIQEFVLNPGYLGEQITSHFGKHPMGAQIHYAKEGFFGSEGWHGVPMGSATTLARLHMYNNLFCRDFIVMCGDALTDIDLADMMAQHRRTGALATIATTRVAQEDIPKYGIIDATSAGRVRRFQEKPGPEDAMSDLASTGIYIFSPDALSLIDTREGQDIAQDLLPKLLETEGGVYIYSGAYSWHDLGCGRDYARTLAQVLGGHIRPVAPSGTRHSEALWLEDNVEIAQTARLTGPIHIASGVRIERGVQIEGPCVIGKDATIGANAVIKNCIVTANSHVVPGGQLQGRILSPFWSVEIEKADGRTDDLDPIAEVLPQKVSAQPAFGWSAIAG